MAHLVPPSEFYRELAKLISLPPHVIALDLRMRVDEIVTATVTYHPEINAEAITKRFELVEIPTPKEKK